MSLPPYPTFPVPPNVSVVSLSDEEIGRGWRRVSTGEAVKTWFEVFILVPSPHWRLSSYFTTEGLVVSGRTIYRAPASLGAWCHVLRPLARKWWQRWTNRG